jgi:hypothetical protein
VAAIAAGQPDSGAVALSGIEHRAKIVNDQRADRHRTLAISDLDKVRRPVVAGQPVLGVEQGPGPVVVSVEWRRGVTDPAIRQAHRRRGMRLSHDAM